MWKSFALSLFLCLSVLYSAAQEALPHITVKDISGRIVVSWQNEYPFVVKTINIQRSYDSLNNYSTIGSVLNPQNMENGFSDAFAPYTKMYYRLFIVLEGGTYIFSSPVRPVKEPLPEPLITASVNTTPKIEYRPQNQVSIDSIHAGKFVVKDNKNIPLLNAKTTADRSTLLPKTDLPQLNTNPDVLVYPSRRIFTSTKDNNISINLPGAEFTKYTVKFFDDNDKPLFELNKIHDSFLIIEKVNFLHAGWFHFEVYENGKIIEKNKFYIPKDGKNPPPANEQGRSNK